MINDLQWYLKRDEEINRSVINSVLETMTKFLGLYSPFISEEIWSKMGKSNFVCLEKWPEFNEKKIDAEVLKQEEIFKKICDDIKQVIRLSKKNKGLYLYVVTEKELLSLQGSTGFLKKELGFENVKVFLAKDLKKHDPENKAKRAKFGKPGIYIE